MQRYEPNGPTDPPPTSGTPPASKYKKAKKIPKTPSEVVIDPDYPNKKDNGMQEEKESTAVFTFGRFNPPTVGHEKLIHKVESVAKEHGGEAHIVASHTENKSKDPLPQDKKIGYLKKVAGSSTHVSGSSKEAPNFLHIAKKLHQAGHKHLVMVAGSDRVDEYKERLEKYNNHPDHYSFKSIKVVSAGARDPDAEGVEGMSGTKMRGLARSGKHAEFKAGLPKALHPHAKEIGDHIRSIPEEIEITELSNKLLQRYKEKAGKQIDTKSIPSSKILKRGQAHLQATIKQMKSGKPIDEETIEEGAVLGVKQRMMRGITARKNKAKLALARKIAKERMAKNPALKRRALKIARKLMRVRAAGKRAKAYSNLSVADKIALDRLVKDKSKIISSIANKIVTRVKSREVQRLAGIPTAQRTKVPMMMSYVDNFKTIIKECGLEEEFIDSVMAKVVAEKQDIIPVSLRAYREKNTKEKEKFGIPISQKVTKEEINDKDLNALQEKAEKSGIPLDVLKTIFNRGMRVANTFKPKSSTAQQSAFARVNSFINKGKSYREFDKDLTVEDTRTYTHLHVMNVARGVEKIERIDIGTKDEEPTKKTLAQIRHRHGQIQKKIVDEQHRIDPIKLSDKLRKKLNKLPRQADVDKVIHKATKDFEERLHRSMADEFGHGFSKKMGEED